MLRALPAVERYERAWDVIKDLEWMLEHHPGNSLSEDLGGGYWLIESDALPVSRLSGVPRVTLIYLFDDATVTFWDIRFEDPPF